MDSGVNPAPDCWLTEHMLSRRSRPERRFLTLEKLTEETTEMTQELRLFETDSIPAILKNQSSQDAKKPGSNDSGKSRRDASDTSMPHRMRPAGKPDLERIIRCCRAVVNEVTQFALQLSATARWPRDCGVA